MNEIDYVRLTNLTKVRILRHILRDLLPNGKGDDGVEEDYGVPEEEEKMVSTMAYNWESKLVHLMQLDEDTDD
jgi:hypothetical protein